MCSNVTTLPHFEYPIEYGNALIRHLTWIYNMKITLPTTDIVQLSYNVSGAFKWPKLHLWIATTFSFIPFGKLYIPSS